MHIRKLVFLLGLTTAAGTGAADDRPMVPATTPPVTYVISYSGDYFRKPDYIEQFRLHPPDLLHIGKATPISHLWGPVRMYQGENQYTGGPGHTLNWDNIALISPDALTHRVETIRRTLRRYHEIGIPEIVPYISYHTLAGDHEKRLGFWSFYDHWETYRDWAGPRPRSDPFDWLVVDINGKFVGGSCGGYSPEYFAPLHRYRACINHPDWAEWHRRLIRMIAEVGYDGCFVDNSHPDPCYCRYCKAEFRKFLDQNRELFWVRRLIRGIEPIRKPAVAGLLTEPPARPKVSERGGDLRSGDSAGSGDPRRTGIETLKLDSHDVPPELVRRARLAWTRDHLGMLRQVGRQVNSQFTIFPNGNSTAECLLTGAKCDRLMFESTYASGIMATRETAAIDKIAIDVSLEAGPTKPIRFRYGLGDAANWIEMEAEVALPLRAQVGQPISIDVLIESVGQSLQDNDFAEDFFVLFRGEHGGNEIRVELEPSTALGASGPSGKGRRPPARLTASWTPARPGHYYPHLGCTYTDAGHIRSHKHLARLDRGRTCRTHIGTLTFAQHMRARSIFLGYESRRKGWENVAELGLAEMAAFSGGGGFAAREKTQAKYRAFFKTRPHLFDGWKPTAPAAVLFAKFGSNPLAHVRPVGQPTIHDHLAATQRLFVSLVDATLPDSPPQLDDYRAIYLEAREYDMTESQLAALRDYVLRGGWLVALDGQVAINGQPISELFKITPERRVRESGRGRVVLWNWENPATPTPPLLAAEGIQKNLRFALYRKEDWLALHVVNYNVCLLEPGKPVLDVENVSLSVPLPEEWASVAATCYEPDAEPAELDCTVLDRCARLSLPEVHLHKIVLLKKQSPDGRSGRRPSPVQAGFTCCLRRQVYP